MKKRRTLVIGLLLVAALALGIGYAGITATLSVNGTAKTTPTDIDIVFIQDGSSISDANAANADREAAIIAASSLSGFGSTDVTFHAYNLRDQGDSVTAVLVIENKSNYAVTLSAPSLVSEPTNFTITMGNYANVAGSDAYNSSTKVLAAGGKVQFTVTATLKNTITTAGEVSETFTVNVHAEGVTN